MLVTPTGTHGSADRGGRARSWPRPRALFGQAPTITRDGARPVVTDGVASTIVDETSGLVWARADRASRMVVEYATTEAFVDPRRVDRAGGARRQRLHRAGPPARPAPRASGSSTACGSRISPTCAAGASRRRAASSPRRRSPGATCRWSSRPTPSGRGGGSILPSAECGPTPACTASSPTCSSTSATPSTPISRWVWPCRSTAAAPGAACRARPRPSRRKPSTSTAATTATTCRTRTCGASTSQVAQLTVWDDHEVRDNWYLERRQDGDPRYAVASVALLAARARQACFEYTPLPIDGRDPERLYRAGPLRADRGVRARLPQLPRPPTAPIASRRRARRRRTSARPSWPGWRRRSPPAPRGGR